MKKTITLFQTFLILLVLVYSCVKKEDDKTKSIQTDTTKTSAVKIDTITSMDDLWNLDSAVYRAPDGECFWFYSFKEPENTSDDNNYGMNLMKMTETNKPCDGETFDGKDRKYSKIRLENAEQEEFDNLKQFRETLPDDDVIGSKTHKPPIQTGENSKRVIEEKRNVFIKQAWFYTYSRQSDEDYHVIVGDSPDKTKAHFFNIEISGLPPKSSSSYKKLKEARDYFQSFFNLKTCKSGYIPFPKKPIEVEFAGTIFFDKLHYSNHGDIGHGYAKGDSYWEIHPVSYIKFKK